MKLVRYLTIMAAVTLTATGARAEWRDPPQAPAIRQAMTIWDKPGVAVEVSPIVVSGDYAIAAWTQEAMGGRALARNKDGVWTIILCAGDQLLDANALLHAGVAEPVARKLVAAAIEAERQTPHERVAMFARFDGLVTMDAHPTPHKAH